MKSLSDRERFEKLTQAKELLREVEFSYEVGDPIRDMIYKVMVDSFSLMKIGRLMQELKDDFFEGWR
jgi:hypothetical protein